MSISETIACELGIPVSDVQALVSRLTAQWPNVYVAREAVAYLTTGILPAGLNLPQTYIFLRYIHRMSTPGKASDISRQLGIVCHGHLAEPINKPHLQTYTVYFEPTPMAVLVDRIKLSRQVPVVIAVRGRVQWRRVFENIAWDVNLPAGDEDTVKVQVEQVEVTVFPAKGMLIYTAVKDSLETYLDIHAARTEIQVETYMWHRTFQYLAMIDILDASREFELDDRKTKHYATFNRAKYPLTVADRTLTGEKADLVRAMQLYTEISLLEKIYGCPDAQCATRCNLGHYYQAFEVWDGIEANELPNIYLARNAPDGAIVYPPGGEYAYWSSKGICIKRRCKPGKYPLQPTIVRRSASNVTKKFLHGDLNPTSHTTLSRAVAEKYTRSASVGLFDGHSGYLDVECKACFPPGALVGIVNHAGEVTHISVALEDSEATLIHRGKIYRISKKNTPLHEVNATIPHSVSEQHVDGHRLMAYSNGTRMYPTTTPWLLGIKLVDPIRLYYMIHDYKRAGRLDVAENNQQDHKPLAPWIFDSLNSARMHLTQAEFDEYQNMYTTEKYLTHEYCIFTPQLFVTDSINYL